MKYPHAAKGINKIYIAEILSIIGAVLAVVLAVLIAVNHIDTSAGGDEAARALESANIGVPFVVYGIIMLLLMLAAYILHLVGVGTAMRDEENFRRAFWVLLASTAFGLLAAILGSSNPQVSNWLKVPSTLFELVATIFVLEGISNLAEDLGKKQIADLCTRCRSWFIGALVLSAAAQVLVSLGGSGSVLNTSSGIASGLLQLIAYVVYLRVLYKARTMQ